jgi:hypothetical protein
MKNYKKKIITQRKKARKKLSKLCERDKKRLGILVKK